MVAPRLKVEAAFLAGWISGRCPAHTRHRLRVGRACLESRSMLGIEVILFVFLRVLQMPFATADEHVWELYSSAPQRRHCFVCCWCCYWQSALQGIKCVPFSRLTWAKSRRSQLSIQGRRVMSENGGRLTALSTMTLSPGSTMLSAYLISSVLTRATPDFGHEQAQLAIERLEKHRSGLPDQSLPFCGSGRPSSSRCTAKSADSIDIVLFGSQAPSWSTYCHRQDRKDEKRKHLVKAA